MAAFSTPEGLADALAKACGSASAAHDFCAATLTLLEMLKDEEAKQPPLKTPLPPRPDASAAVPAAALEPEPEPVEEAAAAVDREREQGSSWGVAITHRPVFMAYDFVKTPPAVRPRAKDDGSQSASATYDDDRSAQALLQHEPPVADDAEQEDESERRRSSVATVKPRRIVVRDRYGEFRCLIKADGTCVNNRGGTIGYLNTEDHMAGSRDEEYLGCAKDQLSGDEVVVEDAQDELAAHMNLGSGCLYDASGAIVAEVKRDGEVSSSMGSLLGTFTPFTMHSARTVLLYLALVDPGMLSRKEAAIDVQ